MKNTKRKRYVISIVSVLFLIAVISITSSAQVPKKINYQGYLVDKDTGLPVGVGETVEVEMTFAIYDVPTGGSPLWEEKWDDSTQKVEVKDGRYSVRLGEIDPIDLVVITTDSIVYEAKPYYLGVKVGTDPEMMPREVFTSAMYALFVEGLSVGANTEVGLRAGVNNIQQNNTFIGTLAGYDTTGGTNTYIGHGAGHGTSGDHNVFIGYHAGYESTGHGNVFLGLLAGSNETGSNRLHIASFTSGPIPLIYGEFDNRLVRINGDLNATSFSGRGSSLTELNASNISSGTLSNNRFDALSDLHGGSGTTFLRRDGQWATPPDNNTTYSAGKGLTLTGTEFSLKDNVDVNFNSVRAKEITVENAGNGIVTADKFVGDGSGLTNLPPGGVGDGHSLDSAGGKFVDVVYVDEDESGKVRINWDDQCASSDVYDDNDVIICGRLYVSSSISGPQKDFNIPDPRYEDENKRLIHSTLEGPEVGVYYRGESRLIDGKAIIALPGYFESLTRQEGRTILLTAKNGWSPLYVDGDIVDGKFVVKTTENGNQEQEFFWEVKAVRADVDVLQVETTGEKGK